MRQSTYAPCVFIACCALACAGESPTQANDTGDNLDTGSGIVDTETEDDTNENEDTSSEDTAIEDPPDECELEYDVDPFADSVVSYQPGNGAGFGQDDYPDIVLGPPYGGGENSGSLDVLSLGENGRITLALEDWIAIDGEGADIIVFENPFIGWYEPGIVSASIDGVNWVEWPCDATDADNGYPGCAGVSPVLSHPDNCIDATDPLLAGGDAYDLADIGLEEAAFIRIVDAGVMGPGGFDLDAISVVNGRLP